MKTTILFASIHRRWISTCILVLGFARSWVVAKDQPFQVVGWLDSGQPILRFTFSKFKDIGGMGKERTYIIDVTAGNLSDRTIGGASLSLYVFDKRKARIGEGYIDRMLPPVKRSGFK